MNQRLCLLVKSPAKLPRSDQQAIRSALHNGIREGCGHLVAPTFAHVMESPECGCRKRFYWVMGLLGTLAAGPDNDKRPWRSAGPLAGKESY